MRVGGRDYEVPIPNRASWTPNAPLRKDVDYFPSPRMKGANKREENNASLWMKGENAELSKLTQIKREEKITLTEEVLTKKARGERRLNRQEKAMARPQNAVTAMQAQAVTKVPVSKPGEDLFKVVKKRGRPPKSKESQVSKKLGNFTAEDREFMFEMLDTIILSFTRRGEKEKVPTKRAIKKAADKKAAEDAKMKAVAEAVDGDKQQADEKPVEEVKEVAVGSAVAFEPAPEESLPQIVEPKEEEVIVARVSQLGHEEEEVDCLKLAIDTLRLECEEKAKVQVERQWKQFNSCMDDFFHMFQDHQQRDYKRLNGRVDRMFERVHCLEKKEEATHFVMCGETYRFHEPDENGLRLPDWSSAGSVAPFPRGPF